MSTFKKTLIAAALVSGGMSTAESNPPVYWPAMAMMPVQFGNQVAMIPVSGWITPQGFLPVFAPGVGQNTLAGAQPPQNFYPAMAMQPLPGMMSPPNNIAMRPGMPYSYSMPMPGQIRTPASHMMAQGSTQGTMMGGATAFAPGMFAPGMTAPAMLPPGLAGGRPAPGLTMTMPVPMMPPIPQQALPLPVPGMMPPLHAAQAPVMQGLPRGAMPRVVLLPQQPVSTIPPEVTSMATTGTAMDVTRAPAPEAASAPVVPSAPYAPAISATSSVEPVAVMPASLPATAKPVEATEMPREAAKSSESPVLRTDAAMVSVPVSTAPEASQNVTKAPAMTTSPGDRDGDGVANPLDLCPDKAGDAGALGCPADQGITLGGIAFHYDSDELTDESKKVLDRLAQKLAHTSGVKLEVAGHTDARGDAMYNLDLSERRARAVRDYLVSQGVGPSRLVAKGYGQTRPLADNESREGRATNRRVELKPV